MMTAPSASPSRVNTGKVVIVAMLVAALAMSAWMLVPPDTAHGKEKRYTDVANVAMFVALDRRSNRAVDTVAACLASTRPGELNVEDVGVQRGARSLINQPLHLLITITPAERGSQVVARVKPGGTMSAGTQSALMRCAG